MKNEPLDITTLGIDSWRQRWLVLGSWNVLHRVSQIVPDPGEDEDMINGHGKAVCGATGYFMIPGFLSRLGLKRCDHCCDLLGIPRGKGAPFNSDEAEREGWNEV